MDVYILKRRYHAIPPLLLILYISLILICRKMSPEHYRLQTIFHISAFGNWQEGLGFFSSFLVLIGILMYSLADQVLIQKIENSNCQGPGKKYKFTLVLYKIGSFLVLAGLVITGCFQQSYNKPGHNIGLVLVAIGFVLMFINDLWFCKQNKLRVGCAQFCLFIVVLVCAVAFAGCHFKSKHEWNKGKDEAIEKKRKSFNSSAFQTCPVGVFQNWLQRNETNYNNYEFGCKIGTSESKIYKISCQRQEMHDWSNSFKCPGKTMNDWLSGESYPNFYPCKSKSLWAHEDPGWEFYEASAYLEIALFLTMIFYTFTYWGLLEPDKVEPPRCFENWNRLATDDTRNRAANEPMINGDGKVSRIQHNTSL